MRYYETLYIVNPNYEQDRFDGVLKTVGEYIEKEKASIVNHYTWGKKRLAYPIQKHKYGTYVLIQFEAENVDFLPEYEQFLRLNKAVLRHQTVKLDDRPELHVEEEPVVDEKTESAPETDEPETTETVEPEAVEAEAEEVKVEDTPEETTEAEPAAEENVSEQPEEEE